MDNEAPSILRTGHVTQYDPKSHRARVLFSDLNITSYWLPILTHNTLKNHDEFHLDIGEHVACIMLGNGCEMGFILGAFYDAKNTPPVHDQNIRAITFSDNTKITYDRKEHSLTIQSPHKITVKATSAEVIAENVKVNGENVKVNGDNVNVSGTKVNIGGDDVSLSGVSSMSGNGTGNMSVHAQRVTIAGDNHVAVNADSISLTAGSISLNGSVTCPGYCKCK